MITILCYILQTFCPQWPIPLLIRQCSLGLWSASSVQPQEIPHLEYLGRLTDTICLKKTGIFLLLFWARTP